MAELSEQQKHSVVTQLAMFARPAEVVTHMLEEWGIAIDRFQVRAYDPTSARFEGGERWRLLFETVRSQYLNDVAKVPIAHRAYRLNELQKLFERTSRSGNATLASSLLEQAAKEVGGSLTNKQVHRVDGPPRATDMSSDERREAIVQLIREAMSRSRIPASSPSSTNARAA